MKKYYNLFEGPWCPLFGHLPELYDKPKNSPERRSVEIIYEARELWGINPYFHTCSTSWPEKEDLPPEKPSEICPIADLKEAQDVSKIGKYPMWKVEAARSIMRASEATLQLLISYSLPYGINISASLDTEWEKAVYFIRYVSRPRLDERITDTEILSILAINEAWHALGSALYWGDCREDVLRQLLISSALLMKCKEVHTKTIINSQSARLEDQERIIEQRKPFGIFRIHKKHWILSFAEETIRVKVKGNKGLFYIHYLLKHPGKSIHISEILQIQKTPETYRHDIIDSAAKKDVELALTRLKEEYKYAEDFEKKEDIEEKIVLLENEIKLKKGKTGGRKFTNNNERMRKAIWKNIDSSLKKLEKKHSRLYEHLKTHITTGTQCKYNIEKESYAWSL